MVRFVSEDGAVDALLPALVNESSPHKESVSFPSSQADVFARTDELLSIAFDPAFEAFGSGVVTFIHLTAFGVGVFRNPPDWGW